MARRFTVAFLAAAALAALSGCGTLLNMSQTPYGGVCNDAQMVAVGGQSAREGRPFGLIYSIGWLADMPFSLVADTLMLPFAPGIDWDRFKPGPSAPPFASGGPLCQEPERIPSPLPNP